MLELSKRISSYTELLNLGVGVLHLPDHQVNSAHNDFKGINEAAYRLLQAWYGQQSETYGAFKLLATRLREVNWKQLLCVLTKEDLPIVSAVSSGKSLFPSLSLSC